MKQSLVLEKSADLISAIGSYVFDGTSISDATRVHGVSLWDVIAPGLAIYLVPDILKYADGSVNGSTLKSFLRSARNRYRELSCARRAGRQSAQRGSTILFLAFEPRQAQSFFSVANLLERHGYTVRLLTSRARAKGKGVDGFTSVDYIEDWLDKEAYGSIKKRRAELGRFFKELATRIDPAEISEDRVSAERLLKWLGQKSSIEACLYEAVKDVELAACYLSERNADVVIGADDCDTRCRACFLYGAENGVPTLHIQYGLVSPEAVNWRFMGTETAALIGQSSFDCLVEMGLDPERLNITGQPRFDALVTAGGKSPAAAAEKKIDILFASQPNVAGCFGTEAARVEMLKEIYTTVKSIDGAVMHLRPHPDEEVGVHRKIINKSGARVVIPVAGSVSIEEAIGACDLLLTFHSTTALEALIADKPVILYGDGKNPIAATYIKSGAVLTAKNRQELRAAILQLIEGGTELEGLCERRHAFVNRHTRNFDAKATERVTELIRRMAGSASVKSRGLVS